MSMWKENSNIQVNGNPIMMMTFPDGAVNVMIDPSLTRKDGEGARIVSAVIRSSDDLMALLLTVDAMKRKGVDVSNYTLKIPFFPYSRQDRVCNPGEALSVSVVAGLINSLGFGMVAIHDPHSDVTPALINNVTVTTALPYIEQILRKEDYDFLISPDTGAEKKVFEIAKHVDKPVLRFSKKRNVKTGQIEGITQIDHIYNPYDNPCKILVIDDICDGGRTFVELAKSISNINITQLSKPISNINNMQLDLYVSHGIFSKGFDELHQYYSKIYYTNSLGQNPDEGLYVLNTSTRKVN